MTLAAYTPRYMPEALSGLYALALDLRWSWHHGSDELWRAIDPELWESTHNAWLVLNSVSTSRLENLQKDESFVALYHRQLRDHQQFMGARTWYSDRFDGELDEGIAYFCMEYGLSESLPLYSGGLGVLAGDYLKTASDLGLPVYAVGLLYQQGYFRQTINAEGEQLEFYPYNDPTMLPVSPLTNEDGEWVRVELPFPGRNLLLRAWKAQVGRCRLLLLDSNDLRNEPGDRGITSELYSGDPEKRLQQEVVLGIGGWRLLRQLGLKPVVCHINEGHSALAFLERAVSWQQDHQSDFDTARVATRPSNLFTTHTSVAAGFDHFPKSLIAEYLQPWLQESGLALTQLMSLGGHEQAPSNTTLNMAYLALNMSARFNGVSDIHRQVTQTIFQPFFPRWPAADIPAEAVTNGVHTPSWDSPEADSLWTRACGSERWRQPLDDPNPMNGIPDSELWAMRRAQRRRLVHYLRRRLASQHCRPAAGNGQDKACGMLLDNETLTLGFARRFTEYKRPDLLLTDEARLLAILNNRDRPVQIVIAGKAHPADTYGKQLIKRWEIFTRHPDALGKVVFIEDYDLGVASQLIQGVDVWLNCPRHPWEACGTSGMKVLVNGGLNLSQYDGWWAEAWNDAVGWAIRPGASFEELSRSDSHDQSDALELYDLLEHQVIPEFYDINRDGIPEAWIHRIRASMDQLTAAYSANRMVREYTERFYIPMAARARLRTPEMAQSLVTEYRDIAMHWRKLRFGAVRTENHDGQQTITVDVYLDGIPQHRIAVELVAEASDYGPRLVTEMAMLHPMEGSENGFEYQCTVPARPEGHYTPRIRIRDDRLELPMENSRLLWLK